MKLFRKNTMKFVAPMMLGIMGVGAFIVLNEPNESALAEPNTPHLATQTTEVSPQALDIKTPFENLKPTLEGTELNAKLVTDEAGRLRISSDLKSVFDYFLSAIEEEDLDIIVKRIELYLAASLEGAALAEANAIFGDYLALKTALIDLEKDLSVGVADLSKENYLDLLAHQLQEINRLRAEHLSPEVHQTFFGDEEAYDNYTFNRMTIMANEQLTESQKQQQMAEIEAQLPEELLASIQESRQLETLRTKTKTLVEEGASKDEINALRQEMYGEEAVVRFEKLDAERNAWDQRVTDYMARRSAILEIDGLTETDQSDQIETLRSELFDSREQIRVKVYERQQGTTKS